MKIIVSGAEHHAFEQQACEKLQVALSDSWQAYRGVTVQDAKGLMEFDLVMVTHDRLVILELKHWSGQLTSYDGAWFVNGTARGKSPVATKRDQAVRLAALLKNELQPTLGYHPFVEAHVVLCGTSSAEHLPASEQRFAHTLDDFLSIRHVESYEAIMGEQPRPFDSERLRPNHPVNLNHFDSFFASFQASHEHVQSNEVPEALSQ